MIDGERRGAPATLEEARARFEEDFSLLDDKFKALNNPPRYPVSISGNLERLSLKVREEALGTNVSSSD